MNYETIKKIYHDLPKYLIPIFWAIAIIVLVIGYSDHRSACKQNKQDEFLWCMKCYPKPDTVFETLTVYKDTCIKESNTFENKDNKGVQSINQKGGQTAEEITNTFN